MYIYYSFFSKKGIYTVRYNITYNNIYCFSVIVVKDFSPRIIWFVVLAKEIIACRFFVKKKKKIRL